MIYFKLILIVVAAIFVNNAQSGIILKKISAAVSTAKCGLHQIGNRIVQHEHHHQICKGQHEDEPHHPEGGHFDNYHEGSHFGSYQESAGYQHNDFNNAGNGYATDNHIKIQPKSPQTDLGQGKDQFSIGEIEHTKKYVSPAQDNSDTNQESGFANPSNDFKKQDSSQIKSTTEKISTNQDSNYNGIFGNNQNSNSNQDSHFDNNPNGSRESNFDNKNSTSAQIDSALIESVFGNPKNNSVNQNSDFDNNKVETNNDNHLTNQNQKPSEGRHIDSSKYPLQLSHNSNQETSSTQFPDIDIRADRDKTIDQNNNISERRLVNVKCQTGYVAGPSGKCHQQF